jgi:hypothetical protein
MTVVRKHLQYFVLLLGTFAKLPKAAVFIAIFPCLSACMSVYLSAWSSSSPKTVFCQILYFGVVPKSIEQIEVWLKFDKIRRLLMKTVMTTLITNITVRYFDSNRY